MYCCVTAAAVSSHCDEIVSLSQLVYLGFERSLARGAPRGRGGNVPSVQEENAVVAARHAWQHFMLDGPPKPSEELCLSCFLAEYENREDCSICLNKLVASELHSSSTPIRTRSPSFPPAPRINADASTVETVPPDNVNSSAFVPSSSSVALTTTLSTSPTVQMASEVQSLDKSGKDDYAIHAYLCIQCMYAQHSRCMFRWQLEQGLEFSTCPACRWPAHPSSYVSFSILCKCAVPTIPVSVAVPIRTLELHQRGTQTSAHHRRDSGSVSSKTIAAMDDEIAKVSDDVEQKECINNNDCATQTVCAGCIHPVAETIVVVCDSVVSRDEPIEVVA